MAPTIKMERLNITLPRELVDEIEKVSPNRSGFLARAARRELRRLERIRRRRELDALATYPEQGELLETGLSAWAAGLPDDDPAGMVDLDGGTPVRWVPGLGWLEGEAAK